jgi:hypothetical protein
VLAFGFAYVFGEPQVQHAIDFEDFLARQAHEPAGTELVGRGMQRTLGLLTGTLAIGVALGGLFALAFTYAYGRVSRAGARGTSAMLALAAFATITLVPFTKYPANPPTIGNPETIDRRTLLAGAMVLITGLSLFAAARVRSQLESRLGRWDASIVAGAAFVVLIAAAQLILPAVHETPKGFPADVLYRFRLASLGINATMWLTIGLGFGMAAERVLAVGARKPAAASRAAAI